MKQNYQNFMIFFTFFLLWFSVQFGKLVEDSVAFAMIISLGILHGANDLLILSNGRNNRINFRKYLLIYLSIILFCILIYLLSPFLAILLFVFLSSYHFGEEHLGETVNVNKIFNFLFFTAYGLFLFSMLFYESIKDVDRIMIELTSATFTKLQIEFTLMITATILLLAGLYLFLKKKFKLETLLKEVFYLTLLFVVFKTSSLILGFAIYFVFWHSIPSILNQVQFISGNLTKESVLFYVKKALIYWGISIVSLLILYYIIPQVHLFSTIVFVVLFAVTAPHTWVMYKMKS
jgi:Brp/Blh family beta-carotene 15,15'-monooxygenase